MTCYASLVLITLLGENNTTPVTSWQRDVRGHNILVRNCDSCPVLGCPFLMIVYRQSCQIPGVQRVVIRTKYFETIAAIERYSAKNIPVKTPVFYQVCGLCLPKRYSNDVIGNDLDGASNRVSTALCWGRTKVISPPLIH